MTKQLAASKQICGMCLTTQVVWFSSQPVPKDDKVFLLEQRLTGLTSPFHFMDAKSLQKMMQDMGAVLSRSAALLLLYPDLFDPNDLDFYATPHGFSTVLAFIQNHGYEIGKNDTSNDTYDHGVHIIIRMVHHASLKSINIITRWDGHIIGMITSFHSTLVMNYMAWYGLVSLYPKWTLNGVGLIIQNSPGTRLCFKKYDDREFSLYHNLSDLDSFTPGHVCCKDSWCPHTQRLLGEHFQSLQGLFL